MNGCNKIELDRIGLEEIKQEDLFSINAGFIPVLGYCVDTCFSWERKSDKVAVKVYRYCDIK